MKTSQTFLLLIAIFCVVALPAQHREKKPVSELYSNGVYNPYKVLDTRVDNMGYWRKAASLGLTSVAPDIKAPEGIFRGTGIYAKSVWRDDSPDVPVTAQNSTQSENSIFVDPNDPDHVLQSNNSTQNPVGSLYGANYFFSFDFGETWGGSVQGAGGSNSGDPATAIGLNGRQFVGFIHSNGGQGVSYSDNGTTWTSVQAGTPPGGYNILDKNHLWIDNSPSSPYKGYVYDAWTGFGNANDSEIEFVRSTNNGVSYSSHLNISSAVNAGSHNQGVNITTGPNGQVYVCWAIYDGWPTDETAIGFARSLNGGATFETATRIRSNIRGVRTTGVSKNQRVNSFPSMTCDIGGDGTIYVVWANIGVPGINTGNDIDIYMIKSSNQGTTWSSPIRVNQDAAGLGHKHYFPWITCDPETSALSVIFYDDRNVGGAQCEVFCANSFDEGNTWEDFRVSDVSFTPTPIPGLAGSYMGDYLGISARGGKVYPVWTDTRSGVAMTYTSPYLTNNLARPENLTGNVTFATGVVNLNWQFTAVPGFLYFNIYRDGQIVGNTTNLYFQQTLPAYGVYEFEVTAVHNDGESTGPKITLQWGDGHISVNPEEIIEYIQPNSTSSASLTITNTGQLDLICDVSYSAESKGAKDYCSASTSTEDEYIANVLFGSINNTSGWQGGVADYTSLVTTLEAGTSASITVTNGYAWASDIVYVWVDWDNDFTFETSGNEQYQLTNVGGQGQTFTGTISVPLGTINGNHRMRVRMTYSTPPEPCGSATYGEIEDYTIAVTGWMTLQTGTFTLAPGSSQTLEIGFNSEDLEIGQYFASISIGSNDPDLPLIEIPVTLNVGLEPVFHFIPVWTSPYNPMTFYILQATLDETDLQAGDEVGIFDIDPNNGEEICVGAGVLTAPLTGGDYLEIIASMDDGSNPVQANGFTPGNAIIYKLYSQTGGEITRVTATYPYPGYDEVFTSQGSGFVELNGRTTAIQNISLSAGWNLMSFRVQPDNQDMLNIVQPLIDQGLLYKVMDEAGNSVFHLPFPPPNGQWSNTIGNMQNTEGYYTKVTGNGGLSVEGYPVETPLEIPLTTGWNIISYPCEAPQNALLAVQPLIDAGVLYKVMDEEGGIIFHLPFPPPNGQWSNSIGNFKPGKGYYIKVTGDATLSFGCQADWIATQTAKPTVKHPVRFNPVWENNPYMPMQVVLYPDETMQAGDEIAVFDGEICVGATVYDGNPENPMIVVTSFDDPTTETVDGFISGHAVKIKVWSQLTGEIADANVQFIEGSETFEALGTCVGKLEILFTGLPQLSTPDSEATIFPNPFTQSTTVSFTLDSKADVTIKVLNMNGMIIQQFDYQFLQKGKQNILLDLTDENQGVYVVEMEIAIDNMLNLKRLKIIKM